MMADRFEFPITSWEGVFGTSACLKNEGEATPYDANAVASVEPDPTWFDLLTEALNEYQESWTEVISGAGLKTIEEARARTPDYGELGWTLWTFKRVYFPEVYDGQWSVASVPRMPCDEITKPIGGGG